MFKWTPFPFVRIAIAFILGILAALNTSFNYNAWFFILLFTLFYFILFLIISLRKKYFHKLSILFGLTGLLVMFLTGYTRINQFKEDNIPSHLINLGAIKYYSGFIISEIQGTENYHKFNFKVTQVKRENIWEAARGKVIVYVKKDLNTTVKYGDRLILRGFPNEIEGPANPGEFDYKAYLANKNIYHQHFINKADLFIVCPDKQTNFFKKWAFHIRKEGERILETNLTDPNTVAVAKALVLGVKDELDNDLKKAYSASGAIHILAVSGLHVGIIYMFIFYVLTPLRTTKAGNVFFTIVSISMLGFYAMITGLSPSVLRAVVMFSFIIIAKAFRRQSNIYNTLAISAVFLLVIGPFLIRSIGFQMSYLAVLGIVYLQPKIYHWISINNRFLDKVWVLLSVSIAAQIATFPLSVYYFHQFPVLFWFSNLIVIPAATFILYSGLGLLLIHWFESLAEIITYVLKNTIFLLNKVVWFINNLSFSVIADISINHLQVIILYFFIVILLMFFYYRKLAYFMAAFICSVSIIFIILVDTNKTFKTRSIMVFDVEGYRAVEFVNGNKGYLFADDTFFSRKELKSFHIDPFNIKRRIQLQPGNQLVKKISDDIHVAVFNGNSILFIDNGFPDHINFEQMFFDYLIVSNNAVSDLGDIVGKLTFNELILDGTNYRSTAKKITKQSKIYGINCHSIFEDGYKMIKL